MHMRLAETCARNLDELRLLLEGLQRLASAVPHAGTHATDELEHAP